MDVLKEIQNLYGNVLIAYDTMDVVTVDRPEEEIPCFYSNRIV
jgi:hypothetical protein